MRNRIVQFCCGLFSAVVFLSLPFIVSAQTSTVRPRLATPINESQLTVLHGNTHPYARAANDRGLAPDSLPMQRMMLVLTRSATQETTLEALLNQQQDKSSPNYHAWLTPQQFGQQFGPADADIQIITSWLQSHGFTVSRVSNGRTVIEFSGTVGQVRDAFHTQIHRYSVNGEDYWANASDPQIPTALIPVVAGVDTLYNFPRHAMHYVGGNVSRVPGTGKLKPATPPLFSFGGNCGVSGVGCQGLSPYDFATIYGVLPLWQGAPAIDGTGETIAVVAESDIAPTDVAHFRQYFDLPANTPTFILDGPDPSTVSGDETETTLDVEWSGAVAKGATIDVVTSESTEASLGVDLSAQYVVDNNLAPILSESYGICELFLGTAGNQFYNQLWQQASAQGITALVATGDSGSAVCDRNAGTQGAAQYGLSVSGFSSTPYNVAVGGTDFFDLTDSSTYWTTTNSVPPGAPAGTPATLSALSYIPETTWDDSCTNPVFGTLLGYSMNAEANCNNQTLIGYGFLNTVGGSGGASNCTTYNGVNPTSCTGGYSKPSWQTGTGVPNDGKRDVPDVSLYAASGSPSGSFYVICEADLLSAGETSCDPSDPNTYFTTIGGTSAATPSFAGIMALVDQKTGSRQGNANYILYKLAAQQPTAFHDVPAGGTIAMPCVTGSPDCNTAVQGDASGILSGYSSTAGYDLATGWGSVNASNLVTDWANANTALKSSSTSLTLNSGTAVNITHGQSVPVSISVSGTGGPPTGNVSLIANTGPDGTEGVQGFVLSSGAASGNTNSLPGGTYNVTAQYVGDSNFAASTSSGTSVTVAPEASKITFAYELIDPNNGTISNSNTTTATFGTPALLRVNVTSQAADACAGNAPGNNGCPTGSLTLTDNGSALDGGTFALNSLGYTEDQAIDLTGGSHTVAANYSGDSSFNAPVPNPATTLLTINLAPTSLSISGSPTNAVVGGVVNLGGTVTAANIFSSHSPSGSLTFYIGNTPIATTAGGDTGINVSLHQATFTASVNITTLPKGQDTITAQYSGDTNYAAVSAGTPIVITVLYPDAVSVGSSSPTASYGSPVTFTAQVTTTQNGGPPMSGMVSFSTDYGLALGNETLSNGSAQVTSSAISGGVHNVIAYYSGDSNYTSNSSSVAETITRVNTTTAVSSSASTITTGQSVTLTATISGGVNGAATPSGTVQFESNGATVGGSVPVSGGQGQLTTTSLAVGSDQITAVYSGDNNYNGSTAPAITETVNATPTFTVAANPTTIPVSTPGASGSTTLTFTGMNGFSSNGAVTIAPTCSNLPPETSCSSGASVTIPTNGTATATVMFLTTAPSAVIPASRNRHDVFGWRLAAGTLAFASLLCAALLLAGYRGERRRWGFALMFAVMALLAVSVGCGGGGGGNSPPPNPGTPVNDYTGISVTVTINGVTETVPNLTIDVN